MFVKPLASTASETYAAASPSSTVCLRNLISALLTEELITINNIPFQRRQAKFPDASQCNQLF